MKGEWCYFKNRFSSQQCEEIITIIKQRPEQEATLGATGQTFNNNHRRSKIRFVQPDDKELSWIFDDLWKMAVVVNDEWFGFHISKLGYIQIAEYSDTYRGEYKRHHDVFYINGDPTYHRKLSCIIQLSDSSTYEGGNLEFYEVSENPKTEDIKSQGTAIFFPSFTQHAATQVTKGNRYSIAAWFDGPKWR